MLTCLSAHTVTVCVVSVFIYILNATLPRGTKMHARYNYPNAHDPAFVIA